MAAPQTPIPRDEFDVTIAHELRQPLTAIRLNADTVLRLTDRPEQNLADIREALHDIIDATQRASDVIDRNDCLLRDHQLNAGGQRCHRSLAGTERPAAGGQE